MYEKAVRNVEICGAVEVQKDSIVITPLNSQFHKRNIQVSAVTFRVVPNDTQFILFSTNQEVMRSLVVMIVMLRLKISVINLVDWTTKATIGS